ncbi:hypothetical protein [Pseudomonas marginalis]|uniref:Uncharacterized protein n=1 Tax=Pseudomonas marginalis TaxID=298 RepID=A0A9X5KRV5_PSEMA|nr:hypothetical protein [Pseudomonas marginalis]OAJ46669.1 hypothetical protein AO064_20250 [Pseudomonas marginalis]
MNLKKGLPQPGTWPGYLADTRQNGQTTQVAERNGSSGRFGKDGWFAKKQQARQLHSICVGGSLWAILGVNAEALTMLRGPIRRRPYNRGEIVAKNAKEMGVFYDFY